MVRIIDSTLKSNQALDGGGLSNEGLCFVDSTVIDNNSAIINGGGILNQHRGQMTISGSSITQNSAPKGHGGGIAISAESSPKPAVIVSTSALMSNRAQNGGGISSFKKALMIERSDLIDNEAVQDGGAIWTRHGPADLSHTTLHHNTAKRDGGGFWFGAGEVSIHSSTLSNNQAKRDGGGINNEFNDPLVLVNSTLSDNGAQRGGGLEGRGTFYNSTVTGSSGGGIKGNATLRNTIVAKQDRGPDCNGAIKAQHFNLDSDQSCVGPRPRKGDKTADPLLNPLANNGGDTKTHLPRMNQGKVSPAIDQGHPDGCRDSEAKTILLDGGCVAMERKTGKLG